MAHVLTLFCTTNGQIQSNFPYADPIGKQKGNFIGSWPVTNHAFVVKFLMGRFVKVAVSEAVRLRHIVRPSKDKSLDCYYPVIHLSHYILST